MRHPSDTKQWAEISASFPPEIIVKSLGFKNAVITSVNL